MSPRNPEGQELQRTRQAMMAWGIGFIVLSIWLLVAALERDQLQKRIKSLEAHQCITVIPDDSRRLNCTGPYCVRPIE